jgi:hypothetical protein
MMQNSRCVYESTSWVQGSRGKQPNKTIVEPKWSQNGDFGLLRSQRPKIKTLEVVVSRAFIAIAGAGFEPATFGL